MHQRLLNLTDELYSYMLQTSLREPEFLQKLRKETEGKRLSAIMQSPPEESQFIALLLQIAGAKNILELGTFTGYSTLWMALAIPADGKVISCDVNDRWANIGKRYWEAAGVSDKIDLRIAPAMDTIDKLLESGKEDTFDFIFIDADKDNYINYYEKALKLVRPGGIIGIDNVLWSGSVIDAEKQGAAVKVIRELNELIYEDERVSVSMLPIGDGLTLAIRRCTLS